MCARGSVLTLVGCCCTLGTVQIAFYRRVADPKSSFYGLMPVPKPIVTRYNRPFHRVLLVLELVPAPFATIPDWRVGSDGATTEALLKGCAALHARFWRLPTHLRQEVAFLYDQKGLTFLGMVRGLRWVRVCVSVGVSVSVCVCVCVCVCVSHSDACGGSVVLVLVGPSGFVVVCLHVCVRFFT
jgi:hypothetical protein